MNTNPYANLNSSSLDSYLRRIKTYPMLEAKEEEALINEYQNNNNQQALSKLLNSHLRLVVSIASKYKGPHVPFEEIISEGNLGLLKSIEKFETSKGYRLSTYATHWIRSYVNEFVMKSWSLVKIGTTSAQKKLFFNLRKKLEKLENFNGILKDEEAQIIAKDLDVSPSVVHEMCIRVLRSDASINVKVSNSDETAGDSFIDKMESKTQNAEEILMDMDEVAFRKKLLKEAIDKLPERERVILTARHLNETVATLDVLSQNLNISKERVRQIEKKTLEKITVSIKLAYKNIQQDSIHHNHIPDHKIA